MLISFGMFNMLMCAVIFSLEEKQFVTGNKLPTIPWMVSSIVLGILLLFLLGYFVMAGVSYYWFKYKYEADSRVIKRTLKFVGILSV